MFLALQPRPRFSFGTSALLAAGIAAPLAAGLIAGAGRAAQSATSLVVVRGGVAPGTPVRGVRIGRSGHGTVLALGSRGLKPRGSFTPSAAQLASIRQAAQRVHAPAVKIGAAYDGDYVAATVDVRGKTRTVLGVNAEPSDLRALVQAVDAALPPEARLEPFRTGRRLSTRRSFPPAACPAGQQATSIGKVVPLKDAAAAGLVTLASKGRFEGDAVSVDARWGSVKARWRIVLNVEVTAPDGAPPQGGWALFVENGIERKLHGYTAYDDEPVTVDAKVRVRSPGESPTPCFHQIEIVRGGGSRPIVDHAPPGQPTTGVWGTDYEDSFAHEALHLVGLRDQYDDVVEAGGVQYPVPLGSFQGSDDPALLQWAKTNGIENPPELKHIPKPGHEHDLMFDPHLPGGKANEPSELDGILRANQNLIIHANPGDLLLDKDSTSQNLGIAAAFDLMVRPGKTAHVDGLVAYCLDLSRHIPRAGTRFDALGQAKNQPEAGMQALQRVLEAVGRRYRPGFLGIVYGAADAVWRVTEDNHDYRADPAETSAILAEAGVPESAVFNTPHFDDPNVSSSATAAVTPSAVLPRKKLPKAKPVRAARARLASVAAVPRSLRATKGPTVLAARVTLAGAGAKVTLDLRHSKGRRALYRHAFSLPVGSTLLGLKLRRLRPGEYRIVASGASKHRSASFSVRKRRYVR